MWIVRYSPPESGVVMSHMPSTSINADSITTPDFVFMASRTGVESACTTLTHVRKEAHRAMTTVPQDQSPRQLSTFVFNGQANIRAFQGEDGEPRFIAADVCKALDITNVGNALARLDDDEKDDIRLPDAMGRITSIAVVTESGLYNLIIRSDKPEAKTFKRWITHEVLPAIRKTGSYSLQPQALMPIQALLTAVQHLADVEAEQTRQADAIRRVEARQDVQDQEREYFSIIGYAAYHKRHIDPTAASQLGKQATRYCKTHSIHIGKKKEALRGSVNTYPEDVLTLVFNAWRSQVPLLDD